jgi:hypothetical protein
MKISSLQLKTIVAILFVAANAIDAQTTTSPVPSAATQLRSATQTPSQWPDPAGKGRYDPIDVVTVTQPGVRHNCRVSTITDDAILCGRFARNQVVYQRDEVATLLLRPRHPDRNSLIASLVFTAVCIASSFFVTSVAAAILLRVAAGSPYAIFLYLASFTSEIGEDGSDHNNDILLYQKSGVPLTVALHP